MPDVDRKYFAFEKGILFDNKKISVANVAQVNIKAYMICVFHKCLLPVNMKPHFMYVLKNFECMYVQ